MGANHCCSYSRTEELKSEKSNMLLSSNRRDPGEELVIEEQMISKLPIEGELLSDLQERAELILENTKEIEYVIDKRLSLTKALIKKQGDSKLLTLIKKSELHSIEAFQNYLEIVSVLDGPFLILPLKVIQDVNTFYIVSNSPNGNSLFKAYLTRSCFKESEVSKFIASILQLLVNYPVLTFLNPEEIYFEETEEIKLKIVPFIQQRDIFKSPEEFCGLGSGKSAVWTLGVVAYILLCGSLPFRPPYKESIVKGIFSFTGKLWNSVSMSGKDLILRMLTVSKDKRPGMEEIRKHPWILGNGLVDVHRKVRKQLKSFMNGLELDKAKADLEQFCRNFKENMKILQRLNQSGMVKELEFMKEGETDALSCFKEQQRQILSTLLENYVKEEDNEGLLRPDFANGLVSEFGCFQYGDIIENDITLSDFCGLILDLLMT
jgi:hypothetical protein